MTKFVYMFRHFITSHIFKLHSSRISSIQEWLILFIILFWPSWHNYDNITINTNDKFTSRLKRELHIIFIDNIKIGEVRETIMCKMSVFENIINFTTFDGTLSNGY